MGNTVSPDVAKASGGTSQVSDGPLKSLADLMLLGDDYDKRARYAPAALAVAPLAVAAFAMAPDRFGGFLAVGLASFVQITMTSLYAHIGRALGNNHERDLSMHGQMPMQRWLCLHNTERSFEEATSWRAALRILLSLDYEHAQDDCVTFRRLGRDAFTGLQSKLRVDASDSDKPKRPLYRIHQEEYGFSRNLVGILPLWLISLCVGVLVTGMQSWRSRSFSPLLVTELIFAACWFAVVVAGGRLVMTGAERLSESLLFAAAEEAGIPASSESDTSEKGKSPERQPPGLYPECKDCGQRWSGPDDVPQAAK